MKSTTLQKRIEKNLFTAKGTLVCRYSFLDDFLIRGIWHGKRYTGRGRHLSLSTTQYLAAIEICEALQLDFELGNDAPRGGKEGDFVKLTAKGQRQIKEYVKELQAIREEKARIEAEKRAAAEAQEKGRLENYKKECEATYNFCKENNVSFDWQDANWINRPGKFVNGEIYHGQIKKQVYHEYAAKINVKNNAGFRQYLNEYVQQNFELEFTTRYYK